MFDISPPSEAILDVFAQSTQASPAAPISREQSALAEARLREDSYRSEIESHAHKKHDFVHCRLKNGKVITGTVHDAGYESFALHSDILGEGTYIYYKDLAEMPKSVPAVGTRFKQGAQWVGLGALIAIALPALIVLSPALFASGLQC